MPGYIARMSKPDKPYPDFPLFAHANGQWAKKIRGKLHYFGKWADYQSALAKYLDEKDYLLSGRTAPKQDGHTVGEVMERFLDAKEMDLKIGELGQRTYDDYLTNCQLVCNHVGNHILEHMTPEDWRMLRDKLAEGVGTTTLGNRVRMARVALRFLEEITGEAPRFGKVFREPSAKAKRKARAEAGERTHTAEEIRHAIANATNPQVKAMILLGINCAFGNEDCSKLVWEKIDLEKGWHYFERPKTYIPRKSPLWIQTIEALKACNPGTGRVFTTKYGNPWSTTAIGHEVAKVGITFYNLRRTFRTVADITLETMAIRLIMGHASPERDMDARYIQRIGEDRLKFVTSVVEEWLTCGDETSAC